MCCPRSLHLVYFVSLIFLCYCASLNEIPKELLRKTARAIIMRKYMNHTVDPCDNFYEFACGNWPELNPKRKEVDSYDFLSNIRDKVLEYVIQLLNETDAIAGLSTRNRSADENSAEFKARLFYRSCVESEIFKYRRIEEYVRLIKSIGGCPALDPEWQSEHFDWVKMIAYAKSYGIDIFIKEYATQLEDLTFSILSKAELGLLPLTRKDGERSRSFVLNRLLIWRIFMIYGVPVKEAGNLATDIMEFVKKLTVAADIHEHFKRAKNPYEVASQIDWQTYLNIIFGRPVEKWTPVYLTTPKYVEKLQALILQSDPRTVANYISVKILFALHPEFNYKKYAEDACATITYKYLEYIVDYLYMEKFYDKEMENDIEEMVANIKESFYKILQFSDWLDDATKNRALLKLNSTKSEVGLKDYVLSKEQLRVKYQNLSFNSTNFYQNNLHFLFYQNHEDHRFGAELLKTAKKLFNTSTILTNAYYLPSKNLIVIPAGIMLPPFYHRDLPKAFAYGVIGSTIGHELTHGFDDVGRHFNAQGRKERWWSNASSLAYMERSKCMIEQYNNYTVFDLNESINGTATLSENIADNGGVREAYYAYKMWFDHIDEKKRKLEQLSPILNMTNTQLFFLSFAQGYCDNLILKDLEEVLNDRHTIQSFRLIGALSNFEEFAKEFNCPLGSKMNPIKKCRVW